MEITNKSVNDLFLSKSEANVESKPAAKSKDSDAGSNFSATLDSKMKKTEPSADESKSERLDASEKPKPQSKSQVAARKGAQPERAPVGEQPNGKSSEKAETVSMEGAPKAQPVEKVEAKNGENKVEDKKKVVVDDSMIMAFGVQSLQTPLSNVEVKSLDNNASVPNPIAQFMVSMESELGVKPEQMLQAFQKLAPEQLLSKPEESIQSVISNLNLPAPSAEKASQMYAKMLAQMSQSQQNQKVSLESDKMALLGALQGSQLAAGAKMTAGMESAMPASKPSEKLQSSKLVVGGENQLANAKLNPTAESSSALALGKNDSFEADSQGFSSDQGFGKFQEGKNETLAAPANPVVQNANQEIKKGQGLNAYGVPSTPKVDQTQQAIKVQSKQAELKPNGVKEEISAESSQASSSLNANPALTDSQSTVGKPAVVAGAAAGTAMLGNANNQAAVDRNQVIQQVMDSARVLSQKGGGEMSVSLKNNELGQIHLKVAAHGNDVAISMVAEQGDTKKLLESNIRDLKLGLSQHNIHADSIKVSVADNSSNNDFRQNPQGHPDFGASREFAGAFQQQQREQREAMMGFASLGNGAGSLNDRIQSRRISSVNNGQVNGRKGNSSVLNLVA